MKLAFISQYYKEFGVTGDQYLAYIMIAGRERTIADLKTLSKNNIQDLVFATTELFNCDEGMSDDQFMALGDWLEGMGISVEAWFDLLENPIFD